MLVLSRKLGEKVIIDGDITLTLVAMEHGGVRLGFEAPRQIPIVREELTGRRGRRKQVDGNLRRGLPLGDSAGV